MSLKPYLCQFPYGNFKAVATLPQPCMVVTRLLQGYNMVVQGVHNLVQLMKLLCDDCDQLHPISNCYNNLKDYKYKPFTNI